MKGEKAMLTNLSTIFADGADAASTLITSSDWDTVTTTVTETAKGAIVPALAVLAIMIAIPLAKKLFKTVSR